VKIVHVTFTPLAGSPIRISDAINKYTENESRVINLNPSRYGNRSFKEDLIWERDKKEAIELVKGADIIHFHNYFNYGSENNHFKFDFLGNLKCGAHYLVHWHTNPNTLAYNYRIDIEDIVDSNVPQLVVAQFHESYYPKAFPVPLIVKTGLDVFHEQRRKPIIFYSPSNSRPAFLERWETKGKPETLKLLKRLKIEGLADYHLVQGLPFDECMKLKSQADIVIDDLVTGSFHTTSLESLALGKPTLSYVDSRTQLVLSELTGTTDIPIVNVSIEHAYEVLKALCIDPKIRQEIGTYSKQWIEEFYSEDKMVVYFSNAYEQLLKTGTLINTRYDDYIKAKQWLYTTVPDLIWKSRKKISLDYILYVVTDINRIKKRLIRTPYIGKLLLKIKYTLKRD